MFNPDTDLLFPPHTLPALRDLRDSVWHVLITQVIEAGPDSLEQIAFVLMMARMNNCANCNADSYRSMNGCTICSTQTLRRSRETDQALVAAYQATKAEVEQYLHKNRPTQSNPLDCIQIKNR